MEKIDDNAAWFQIKRKLNELVEGYNEIMERLNEHINSHVSHVIKREDINDTENLDGKPVSDTASFDKYDDK